MAKVGISRLPSTPRRHTVEVSASLGPQQAGRIPINAVHAMDVYLKGGPVFRLTHQGSVPLAPSDPIVYAKNLATLCSPSTQKWSAYQGAQVLLGNIPWRYVHHRALSRRDHLPINALSSVRPVDVHVQSVRPTVCAFWP